MASRAAARRYGVNPDDARKAGLYLTEGTDHHLSTEPAILAVKPEDAPLRSVVQSSTHARPHFAEVLSAVESMLAKDLPRPPGGRSRVIRRPLFRESMFS